MTQPPHGITFRETSLRQPKTVIKATWSLHGVFLKGGKGVHSQHRAKPKTFTTSLSLFFLPLLFQSDLQASAKDHIFLLLQKTLNSSRVPMAWVFLPSRHSSLKDRPRDAHTHILKISPSSFLLETRFPDCSNSAPPCSSLRLDLHSEGKELSWPDFS